LALGRTVSELEATISVREFEEWIAFYSFEPWGDERADIRSGVIASTVANVHLGGGYSPTDFMPYLSQEKKEAKQAIKTAENINKIKDGFMQYQQRKDIDNG